jgi:hypothetical protein
MSGLINNLRAGLKLIGNDHITPQGRRILESILSAHDDPGRPIQLRKITTLGDFAGLPVGTRIATNHNKLLILEEFPGGPYWFEDGGQTPCQPLIHWLPVYILPPVATNGD